jgi:hypothetical protein
MREGDHPLAVARFGKEMIDEPRRGVGHAAGQAGRPRGHTRTQLPLARKAHQAPVPALRAPQARETVTKQTAGKEAAELLFSSRKNLVCEVLYLPTLLGLDRPSYWTH